MPAGSVNLYEVLHNRQPCASSDAYSGKSFRIEALAKGNRASWGNRAGAFCTRRRG